MLREPRAVAAQLGVLSLYATVFAVYIVTCDFVRTGVVPFWDVLTVGLLSWVSFVLFTAAGSIASAAPALDEP